MARDPQISDPIKVTLYLPRLLTQNSKDHARDVENTSLSKMITQLLTEKLSQGVPRTVDVPKDLDDKLLKEAEKKGLSVEELIAKKLAAKPRSTKKTTIKKRG